MKVLEKQVLCRFWWVHFVAVVVVHLGLTVQYVYALQD